MTVELRRRATSTLRVITSFPMPTRIAFAALAALALSLAATDGGPWGVIAAVLAMAIVAFTIAVLGEPEDLRFLLVIGLAAIVTRVAVTSAFDLLLVARTGGHIFAPDEGVYLRVAHNIVDNWRDPSVYIDNTDGFVLMQYTRLIARIYYVIGDELLVIKLMNTTFAVVAAAFGYRAMVNLGLPGRRWAFVLSLVFPSVLLWSSLALKDAYIWFFEMAAIWSSSEYIRSRNHWWHFATLAALLPIESVRRYIFVTLAIAWLFVVLAMHGRERLRAGAVIASTVVFLFVIIDPFGGIGLNFFSVATTIREAGSLGGRTSFVEAPVIRGSPGDRVLIRSTTATPDPSTTPREVVIRPGDCVVFVGSSSPDQCHAVAVRPGDIAVFASPAPASVPVRTQQPTQSAAPASATPTQEPTPLPVTETPRPPIVVTLNPDAKNGVSEAYAPETESASFSDSLATNARHLPIGISYTLLAPFPWAARTASDLATIPEVLLWWTCLVLAWVGLVQLLRARDLRYAHGIAAICGLTIVFALIQSNVGTLIRSRDMLILPSLALTGVGCDYVFRRWPGLLPRAVRSVMFGSAPSP